MMLKPKPSKINKKNLKIFSTLSWPDYIKKIPKLPEDKCPEECQVECPVDSQVETCPDKDHNKDNKDLKLMKLTDLFYC